MENIIVGWEDILDEQHSKETGEYLLYRNYKVRDESGYKISQYNISDSSTDNNLNALYETIPVARGLTAFAAKGSQPGKNILDFLTPQNHTRINVLFESYQKNAFKKASFKNRERVYPLIDDDLEKDFLPSFILAEVKNLTDSEQFYSECQSEKEHSKKELLRLYVKSYIDSVIDEYRYLLRHDYLLDNSLRHKSGTGAFIGSGIAPELPVEVRLLAGLDDLLRFIHQRFYEQAFPASRSFISPITGFPLSADAEYIYNLRLASDVFDSGIAKNKIRALLIQSGTNIPGLLTLLGRCMNLAQKAALLFETILVNKRFNQQCALFVSVNGKNGEYTFHNSIQDQKGFIRFLNKDLYYFCEEISLFIKEIISFVPHSSGLKDDLTPAIDKKNNNIASGVKIPVGILEFKINAALNPLTIAEGLSVPCIETAYKNFLVRALLEMQRTGEIPACLNKYTVRNNNQFYSVINSVKNEFSFETKEIVELISTSTGKAKKTILNCLALYKSETK